jgi:hypothetical protein
MAAFSSCHCTSNGVAFMAGGRDWWWDGVGGEVKGRQLNWVIAVQAVGWTEVVEGYGNTRNKQGRLEGSKRS